MVSVRRKPKAAVDNYVYELLIAIDRGNWLIKVMRCNIKSKKYALSKTTSAMLYLPTGSTPYREVEIPQVNGKFICRDGALIETRGQRRTPLDSGDKVKGLALAVADAIAEELPEGTENWCNPPLVHVAFSNPSASPAVEKTARLELEKLTTDDGFKVSGEKYTIKLGHVDAFDEGFLFLQRAPRYIKGLMDFGSGTLQAAHLLNSGEVQPCPPDQGDKKGAKQWLAAVLRDEGFKGDVARARLLSSPSAEDLAQTLGAGNFVYRGIKLLPPLKRTLKPVLNNIANCAVQLKTSLRDNNVEMGDGERIVIVGGGACLIEATATNAQLQRLADDFGIEIWPKGPDTLTARQMTRAMYDRYGWPTDGIKSVDSFNNAEIRGNI